MKNPIHPSKLIKRKMKEREKSNPILLLHNEEESDSLSLSKHTVPVGPRFQAEIPNHTDPPSSHKSRADADELKWLGTKSWPIKKAQNQPWTKARMIGKGRADICSCTVPGSIECVKTHVSEKRQQLLSDLGPAFWNWKFDGMGEGVYLKSWKFGEQMKFVNLVKMNPTSQGKCFLKQSCEILPSKTRKELIDYYFNVYIPGRLGMKTRLGCKSNIGTDDDDDDDGAPLKRAAQRSSSNKDAKTMYLIGRR